MRDLDILTRMEDVSVNISLNTMDAAVIRMLEPASPLPAARLETIHRLSDAGVDTSLFVAPVLPLITDAEDGIRGLLTSARERGAVYAMISLLRLSRDVKKWYLATLKLHFPQLVQSYRELYSQGAYAEGDYIRSFKAMAALLLAEFKLDKRTAEMAETIPSLPRRMPEPSKPVTGKELMPEVEQLSFPF